jgi:hypothetical protein
MVDRVGDERMAFIEFLIARGGPGDLDAVDHELDLVTADLEATPDGWELRQLQELEERHRMGLIPTAEALAEEVNALAEEAERRRAKWLGEAAEASEEGT